MAGAAIIFIAGLSPRVRRHLAAEAHDTGRAGSISACAEASLRKRLLQRVCKVYLRVCGGIANAMRGITPATGLSPRVRRHRLLSYGYVRHGGSISACAEASRIQHESVQWTRVYLRVCGGIAPTPLRLRPARGLSPRVRRHRRAERYALSQYGSISACAEASPSRSWLRLQYKVYLRVCGGIAVYPDLDVLRVGLSPRVRRHPCVIVTPGLCAQQHRE